MKKVLKILSITLASIIAFIVIVLIVASIVLSYILDPIVKNKGNEFINGHFDYKKLSVNLIRKFPNVSVSLKDFYLDGAGAFQDVRLVEAGEIMGAVNIASVFSKSGYEVSEILLKDISANIVVKESGEANWDIIKKSDIAKEEKVEVPKKDKEFNFKIQLKKIVLANINANYSDEKNLIFANVKSFNTKLKGNFSLADTTLDLHSYAKELSFKLGDIPFLRRSEVELKTLLEADLKNKIFKFKESFFRLNQIKLDVAGQVGLPKDRIDVDVKLSSNQINLINLISLIPERWTKPLDKIKSSGVVSLTADAKGYIKGNHFPAFNIALNVKNGGIKYDSLPSEIKNINIYAEAKSYGGILDNIFASIKPLSFSIENNPFNLVADLKTPISDPDFNAELKGKIDLNKIKDVYPIDNLKFSGNLDADIKAAGKLSYLKEKKYDKFNVNGFLKILNMDIAKKHLPKVNIKKASLFFTSNYLDLKDTFLYVEDSDLTVSSKIENYIGYLFNKDTIRGSINIDSKKIDADKILASMKSEKKGAPAESEKKVAEEKKTEATTKSKVIVVPKNIDFNAIVGVKKLIFQEINIDNVKGNLLVKDGIVNMKNIDLNVFDGSVGVNGKYSTATDIENPDVDATLDMTKISFIKIFKDVKFLKTIVPLAENLQGNFSNKMFLSTKLNNQLSPIVNTMNGDGTLETSNIDLSGIEVVNLIGVLAKRDDIKNATWEPVKIEWRIKNGKLITTPFDLKVGDTTLNLSGSSILSEGIEYKGVLKLPSEIEIPLSIKGSFKDPKVNLDMKNMVKSNIDVATKKGLEALNDKYSVDLRDAEKQKVALIEQAKISGQKIIDVAKIKAQDLESGASGPFERIAAKASGEIMVKEATRTAELLVKEAEQKGNRLIESLKK